MIINNFRFGRKNSMRSSILTFCVFFLFIDNSGQYCACFRGCSCEADEYCTTHGGYPPGGICEPNPNCNGHSADDWGSWSSCTPTSVRCTKSRSLIHRDRCGRTTIGGSESIPCDAPSCPVNGSWSVWGQFHSCDKTCGGGLHLRFRTCNSPSPSHGGIYCIGDSLQSASCNDRPCPGILSWTVDDLCRNIPNFVFEDKELCSFFYDCSQKISYLQQCPYPQLFSDINTRCEDPNTVSCGSRTKIYGYTCDFEILDDANCFLVDSDSGTFTWTRNAESTPSDGTGPSSAYHGSFYTYIETSSPRELGDNAILESDKTFQDRTYCLNLFYHMRGSHIGSLIIKTENSSNEQAILKQISGNQGNSWQRMDSLDIHLNEDTKILIEATRGSSYKGDISIDLVALWPRKCTKSERQVMTARSWWDLG